MVEQKPATGSDAVPEEESKAQQISLTVQEQKIFRTLMEILQAKQLDTQMRVAGGWVRDKVSLLFLISQDTNIVYVITVTRERQRRHRYRFG